MKRLDTILILDFGSQYTQLIARRIRELHVFSVIEPFHIDVGKIKKISPKGIILSGGPHSVYDDNAPSLDKQILDLNIPILGICYGMQILVKMLGGRVEPASKREYGKSNMYIDEHKSIFANMPSNIVSWMSHSDQISSLPPNFITLAHTANAPYAAIGDYQRKIFGVQFHPEVVHTQLGIQIISNFLFKICGCFANWQLEDFISEEIEKIRKIVDKDKVICGLSGGVDSSTLSVLLHKAVGKRLKCIFINNGLLRKSEPQKVLNVFRKHFNIDLIYINAQDIFLKVLKGVVDPEEKRKIIGNKFIEIFEREASKIKGVKFLAQGTLYPDVIESISLFGGPTAKIKSHHNVGGLPLKMKLKLVEPFRLLFKDEVREIAKILGLPEHIIWRHPFPGPGLGIRILGEITKEKIQLLREADEILEKIIRKNNLYRELWQSFCVLLPVKSVGVMGDKRTYEYVLALRLVSSTDGMTADWAKIPYEVLEEISNTIINEVKGINRVVLDISSKPPATIEWE